MIKLKSHKYLVAIIAFFVSLSLINLDYADARGRRGGGGRSRGGGSSRRVNRSATTQNRGNFSSHQRSTSRSRNVQNRSTNRSSNLENRQSTRQNRQDNLRDNRSNRQDQRTNRTEIRQEQRTNRTDIRQNERSDRQRNRQDFIDDNYYGRGWYGGGYYRPPGWGAWGAATFTAGVIVGATVSSPPPYYDTVYVGSTTYIYSDGVYLEPSGSSYVVVDPPIGAVVDYLPEGCVQTQVNNVTFFDCGGIYYQPFYQEGATVYQIVDL